MTPDITAFRFVYVRASKQIQRDGSKLIQFFGLVSWISFIEN